MTDLRQRLFSQEEAGRETASNTAVSSAQKTAPSENSTAQARQSTQKNPGLSLTGAFSRSSAAKSAQHAYDLLKRRIHHRLVESIDISKMLHLEGNEALENTIAEIIQLILEEESLPLTAAEREKLGTDVLNETLGLGPLEPLLADSEINDILVNGFNSVWIDRNGVLEETDIKFSSEDHLLHVINRIVARIGRRIDESSPIVDARLPDGSRVNAIIPPLSLEGAVLSIRRFRATPFHFEDLIARGTVSRTMADFLELAVAARLNILISGGTSAGKTTLLNVLSEHISDSERIVTIEDTAELRLQQRHVVRLESRPANIEGRGAVPQRELVKNALRMRPDRIVVGEVRGAEALDMLQAMNTGHEGSLTTVHANSPRDAMSRIETLVLLAGIDLSQRSIREQIGSAFDLIVQVKRLSDGSRRVVSISEITGVSDGVISMQELFCFKLPQHETAAGGKAPRGFHTGCGLRPMFMEKFQEAGIDLPSSLFQPAFESKAEMQQT